MYSSGRGMLGTGEVVHVWGQGIYEEPLHLLNLAVNLKLKTTLKAIF